MTAMGHVWMAPGWQGIFSHGGSVVLRSCVRRVGAAEAAGPDGNRGSRPDQTHGVALPLDPKQVALDPSIDRRCHHASSPSQAPRACRRRPFRPPPEWPGSPPGASSGPSRCAPSVGQGDGCHLALLVGKQLDQPGLLLGALAVEHRHRAAAFKELAEARLDQLEADGAKKRKPRRKAAVRRKPTRKARR